MQTIYTFKGLLMLAAGLLLHFNTEAQTTYFEQDFSGAGPFTSRNPNATQFDTIYVTSPTVVRLAPNQGYVELERSVATGGGSARVVRSTDLSPIPTTMYYQVRLNVVATGQATANVATFNVGQNLSPSDGSVPPDANLFGKVSINFVGGGSYRFSKTGTNPETSNLYSGSVLVTWVLNNLTTRLKYLTPNNTIDSVNAKTYDLWIDDTRFLRGSPSLSTVQLSDISFRFQTGIGIIRLTDFRIRDVDGILPVNLNSFNAQAIDDRVELAWKTAWERNSREFVVQRSGDLKEFGDIGRVAAMGKTEGPQQYTFTDNNAPLGTGYYRLRIVNQDGSYKYSKVEDVVIKPGMPLLLVSPNPATGGVILIKVYGIDVSSLRLTSLLGRPIRFSTHSVGLDTWEIHPESTLVPGMYFLHSDQNSFFTTFRFIVE